MAFGIAVTETASANGLEITSTRTYTDSQLVMISESCANSATTNIGVSIDVSEISAICLMSTQDVTLETNSASEADETIELLANRPLLWTTDSYYANLLETDITSLHVTNASGSAALFTMSVVFDGTP